MLRSREKNGIDTLALKGFSYNIPGTWQQRENSICLFPRWWKRSGGVKSWDSELLSRNKLLDRPRVESMKIRLLKWMSTR